SPTTASSPSAPATAACSLALRSFHLHRLPHVMRYRVRLIAEAGPDPLTGEQLEGAEEVIEVEADSLEHARRRAPHAMTMRLRGQLLRFYDDETGEEITADREQRPFRRATFVIDSLP